MNEVDVQKVIDEHAPSISANADNRIIKAALKKKAKAQAKWRT